MAAIQKRRTGKGISWRVLIRRKGHKAQCKTFDTKDAAMKWAVGAEEAIKAGKPMASNDTFETLARMFWEDDSRAHLRSNDRAITILEEWCKVFGEYTIGGITTPMVNLQLGKVKARRLPDGSKIAPATVNRRRAVLSAFFRWCVRQGMIESNPVMNTDRLKEPNGRVRYLSDEERVALFAACKEVRCPMLYSLVVIATYSGMRRGEILALDWKDVDLNSGAARVLRSKNGEARGATIAGPALEALRAWKEESAPIPFIGPRKIFPGAYPKDAFRRAVRLAGIEDLHFHDLRHSACSYLAMMGASNRELMEFLGHKSLAMSARYSHLAPAHIMSKVSAMAERFR
jgi:integrase